MTILLDEVLLHHTHLTALVVRSFGKIHVTSVGSAEIKGVSIHGLDRVGLLSLAEGALRHFIEAHACASTGRSLKHLPLIG